MTTSSVVSNRRHQSGDNFRVCSAVFVTGSALPSNLPITRTDLFNSRTQLTISTRSRLNSSLWNGINYFQADVQSDGVGPDLHVALSPASPATHCEIERFFASV